MEKTVATVFCLVFTLVSAFSGDAVRLEPGVAARGSTASGNQRYTFELPPDALLMTVAVRSAKSGNHLDLFMNEPGISTLPARNNSSFQSTGKYGGGSNENLWLLDRNSLKPGTYRLLVEKVDNEGCEYTIVCRYQQPIKTRLGDTNLLTTADDPVNGAKFLAFDIDDDYDFLDVEITSESAGNGLDLYLNTPDAQYYPDPKSHEYASNNKYGGGNQEWLHIDPPAKVKKGTYRISVMRPGDEICPQFRLSLSAEKIPLLSSNKPLKKPTRREGEYFLFEVPEGARTLTVATESIVKGNILDLYLNAPIDEAFPTKNAYRFISAAKYGEGAQERIEVDEPDPGMWRIWVSNNENGKDYIIRASWK